MKIEKTMLAKYVHEVRERVGSRKKVIYSVTNQRGFIPALETFGKQVFSEDTSNYKVAEQYDLAFNPSRINVGSVALCPDENGGAVSPMYTIVRCCEGLLPEYLLYFLRSPIGLAEINHRTVGAVRFQLKFSDLQRIPIYLPSISEQERIVRILDEADELRGLRAQADRRTAELIPALFYEMFGRHINASPITAAPEIPEVPRGWHWLKLTQVARLESGHTPSRNKPEYWNGNIGWISLTDIRDLDGRITTKTLQNVTQKGLDNSSARLLPKGTVCLSRTASVGFVTVMGEDMSTSQDFVNWVCGEEVNPIYLMWSLIYSRKTLLKFASGSTHKTIYVPVVQQFRGLIPPLPLQQQFAARVAEVRALEERQAASRERLDDLFQSLLYRAFRGEL